MAENSITKNGIEYIEYGLSESAKELADKPFDWFDLWGVCHSGLFTHAEYRSEQEAIDEVNHLKSLYKDVDVVIAHIPKAGFGNVHLSGFGPHMKYRGIPL